jgi:hypothetical protein
MTAVHKSFCCSLFATPFEGSDTKAPPLAPRVHAASLPPPCRAFGFIYLVLTIDQTAANTHEAGPDTCHDPTAGSGTGSTDASDRFNDIRSRFGHRHPLNNDRVANSEKSALRPPECFEI